MLEITKINEINEQEKNRKAEKRNLHRAVVRTKQDSIYQHISNITQVNERKIGIHLQENSPEKNNITYIVKTLYQKDLNGLFLLFIVSEVVFIYCQSRNRSRPPSSPDINQNRHYFVHYVVLLEHKGLCDQFLIEEDEQYHPLKLKKLLAKSCCTKQIIDNFFQIETSFHFSFHQNVQQNGYTQLSLVDVVFIPLSKPSNNIHHLFQTSYDHYNMATTCKVALYSTEIAF